MNVGVLLSEATEGSANAAPEVAELKDIPVSQAIESTTLAPARPVSGYGVVRLDVGSGFDVAFFASRCLRFVSGVDRAWGYESAVYWTNHGDFPRNVGWRR